MNNLGKKITVYLKEGLPRGVREVQIDGWLGKAVCGPRIKLGEMRALDELREGACVYFLFGTDADSSLPKVYVGEADPFAPRGKQHDVAKDWWEHVVI
ncbi:MAG: hypothetical protein Q8R36_03840 [bacterium]|nr:hypothetical protein [bacterium]